MAELDKVTEAQRLLAEMQQKYGGPAPKAEAPAPAPQPIPQPQQKQEPGGLLKRATTLFGDRTKQIDKAAGYACGGKVKAHAQGGKIKGPGTPTSDSIPAKIQDTGEDILVSNGERILSKEQDDLLLRIAQMLGFDTVDALLESGTGKPVGPTLKDGKRAARYGANGEWIPDEADDVAPKEWKTPGSAPGLNADGSIKYAEGVTPNQVGPGAMLIDAMGSTLKKIIPTPAARADDARAKVQADLNPTYPTDQQKNTTAQPAGLLKEEESPGYTPQDGPQQVSPIVTGRNDKGIITADSAAAYLGSDMRDNKVGPNGQKTQIFGTADVKGVNEILARENKARGEMIDMMPTGFATPSAPMMPGQLLVGEVAPGVTRQDAENAEKTRQWALDGMRISDREKARLALGYQKDATDMRGQDISAQRAAGHDAAIMRGQDMSLLAAQTRGHDPLDQRKKQLEIGGLEEIAALRGRLLDPKTPEADRLKAAATLRALSGKTDREDDFKIASRKVADPNNPGGYLEIPYVISNGGANEREVGAPKRRQVTEKEIAETAKIHGITPEQVKQKLGLA